MNKKSNIFDVTETAGIIISIVLVLFIVWTVQDNFGTQIKLNNATNISSVTGDFDTFKSRSVKAWDYGILFMVIMFPIFSYLTARKIPSDTKYMILTWFVLGFIFLMLMIVSNIYGKMMDVTKFADFVNNSGLIFIPIILPRLVYYGFIYVALVLVGLYTKTEI